MAVGETSDGHAHGHIEDREREPHQEAHFGVADLEVGTDGLYQQRDHLPVDERNHLREHEDNNHIPGIDEPAPWRLRVGAGWSQRIWCRIDEVCLPDGKG